MGGIYSGPGGQVRGPGGAYSSTSTGSSDAGPSNVVDGSGGTGGDPTVSRGRQVTVGDKKVGQASDVKLTWEQRALRLLSRLQTAKGFKDLQPKLKEEIRTLIDDAPDSARS